MKFKLQQTTALAGNTKYKQLSLHPEFTPFSVSVSCAKLSITQELLWKGGLWVQIWMQSALGQAPPDSAKITDNYLTLRGLSGNM